MNPQPRVSVCVSLKSQTRRRWGGHSENFPAAEDYRSQAGDD